MEFNRISKWMVIIGALVILSVKLIIRPMGNWGQPLTFFFGIAPNLFGSFLVPFGACWLFRGKRFFPARFFQIDSIGELRLVCLLGLGMLVVNEYLQLIPVFGRTFDYFDILSSLAGLTASYFVFIKMHPKLLFRYYPD